MDICPCNICPDDICPYQQYLSCYWPDFDQILKVDSWDLFEHIPTVTITFVHTTLVFATYVHIRKFEGRFLGQSTNSHSDICKSFVKKNGPKKFCPTKILSKKICQRNKIVAKQEFAKKIFCLKEFSPYIFLKE